ncbi:MAG: HAMP domain-containing histidine kinase [Candidatus Omnitrophica bacterium]|nr:HAMP domain-containing histidine kinase [Candidatus Omnitrophota bacterium]
MSYLFSIDLGDKLLVILSIILCSLLVYFHFLNKKAFDAGMKIRRLEKSLEDVDHQAKLIIKNDMELKLYQDAINDKLQKLSFIKNFIGASLNTLDRKQLFSYIVNEAIQGMGFKNACIIPFNEEEDVINMGFDRTELAALQDFFRQQREQLDPHSLFSIDSDITMNIRKSLHTRDFLIGSIFTGPQIYAGFCVADCTLTGGITESERQVFSILCMYLSQSLENIQSFEKLYRSGEELEQRIKEKTFQLTQTLQELEVISKRKSDFISSVSHELRTPLTSIKGFSSLLVAEKFGKLPDAAQERLKKVDDNVNKLVSMVNTLLDIARIESKRIEIKIAPSDISKLARDVSDFLMPQVDAKRIQLHTDVPQTLMAYMDANLIERVFINLINNAIKFTLDGGRIMVKCVKEHDQVVVSVADTGLGIPKEDIENIFHEFYRVNTVQHREIKGTGLGLSLVQRIIETHGQKIWVESELEKGTTFYFTLKAVEHV